jgi:hypothetical protein
MQPAIDQEPGAGVYVGIGRFSLGRTMRMPVILSLLFSAWKGSGGGSG